VLQCAFLLASILQKPSYTFALKYTRQRATDRQADTMAFTSANLSSQLWILCLVSMVTLLLATDYARMLYRRRKMVRLVNMYA
jgi:hypothetical protein